MFKLNYEWKRKFCREIKLKVNLSCEIFAMSFGRKISKIHCKEMRRKMLKPKFYLMKI